MLKEIPVRVALPVAPGQDFGNALPLLHEIRHALTRLADTGEPTAIDLGSIPFGPGDEGRLLAALGRGEVAATVHALGETHVWETGFHGVWIVDHRNADGERLALHVEIAPVPQILGTDPQDIRDACTQLDAHIAQGAGTAHPGPVN